MAYDDYETDKYLRKGLKLFRDCCLDGFNTEQRSRVLHIITNLMIADALDDINCELNEINEKLTTIERSIKEK